MYESGVYAVRCAWSHGEGVVGGKGKFEESRWISSMEMFGVLGCVLVCATVFFRNKIFDVYTKIYFSGGECNDILISYYYSIYRLDG